MQTDVEPRLPSSFRLLQLAALALWLLGTWALIDHLLLFPVRPGTGPDRDFPIEVGAFPTLEQVANALAKANVIAERGTWLRGMRLLQAEPHLRRHWIAVNRARSTLDLMPRIFDNRGRSAVTLNIPEGFTRFDTATRLERFGVTNKREFLAAAIEPALLKQLNIPADSAEGYLFPATYRLDQYSAADTIVTRMVTAFRSKTHSTFERLAQVRSTARLTLSDHEALTLASIVEREAQAPEERAIIAGVFVNRLADPTFRPHRLQSDPTAGYGCLVARKQAPSCAEFDGRRITRAMVRDPLNPYNTYRLEGLPPGPISNPGLASLEAVVSPMSHDFFYFVASGGGRHKFSHTLDEHNAHIHGPN